MARFLVTRPEQDARTTAGRLAQLGHEAVVAPLMDVRVAAGPALDLAGVQAVLLTSANGARAFAERAGGAARDVPVLCVGDATAGAARAAGMTRVDSAGGDVDDLARLAAARLDPAGGALLHVAGTKVAGDLAGMLTAAGFACRRAVLYEARAAAALPAAARAALAAGDVDGVLLYSPRSAGLFRDLAGAAGLDAALAALTALCLSPAVAARAGDGWRRVEAAGAPTEDSLMDLVRDLFP